MINIPNLTQNYNLNKPLGSERVDVNVLNKNSDILDTTLKSISIKSEAAYNHSNSAHARTDATKTEKSNINGNILINGVETEVYRHPLGRNPHGLIKSDIGLGNVDNTSDINKPVSIAQQEAINNAVKNKVDKVNGKGLSTNDYTTEEKNKLASINVSAEENQNAFSKVKVGNKTISSNEKMGTFELVAGNNVGLSVDSNTNKITISSTGGSGGSGGNQYVLPVASNILGGIKSGTDITVDSSGNVSVNDNSHNHTISNISNLQSSLNGKLPIGTSNDTYTTLADFWTYCDGVFRSTVCWTMVVKCKLSTFVPVNGWYRCIVSAQNRLGNGSNPVVGSVILDNGANIYYGIVSGGKDNTSDLTVTWKTLGGSPYCGATYYSSSEPTSGLTNGLIWIG